MSRQDYYGGSSGYEYRSEHAPTLPPIQTSSNSDKPLPNPHITETPVSPFDEDSYATRQQYGNTGYQGYGQSSSYQTNPFSDDAAIPLRTHYPKHDNTQPFPPISDTLDFGRSGSRPRRPQRRKKKKQPFFSWHTPWFIYTITLIQITIFIVEIVKNSILTGSPIEIHPTFNPMIGPSPYVLINMGARYVPCMRNQEGVQNNAANIKWPCPDQTDTNPTCTLSELCGFGGVPNPEVNGSLDDQPMPNQWYRFIVPIFLHAGLIHIGFNMLLQILLGGDMERAIGPVRLALVYFSSGIFGFVMGGNFAASGIASTGASGSLFGIIALTLLDILYTWQTRKKPLRDLIFIILDICICFVLGLLPGLDNFSHIGGFLMGIVLGICLLRSPTPLRARTGSIVDDDKSLDHSGLGASPPAASSQAQLGGEPDIQRRTARDRTSALSVNENFVTRGSSHRMFTSPRSFFSNRKPLWWAWWLLRAGALVGVIIVFIVLIKSFYTHHDTQCSSCKYLSCLPVSNWCEIGDLTFKSTDGGGTS